MKTGFLIVLTLFALSTSAQKAELVDFTTSECDQTEDSNRIKSRIVSQIEYNDTLQIEIGTVATCCVDFIPSIDFQQDTLSLLYSETGDFCDCLCCYQFKYHIVGLTKEKFITTLQDEVILASEEKYKTYPIEYFVFNEDTTGYRDKYGFRQGVEISLRGENLMHVHWKDDETIQVLLTDVKGVLLQEFKNVPELWDYETRRK